ncbi:MAG: phospholipase D-like domain-containing protein [Endomicrobium sp.]|jgi:cardiolipin synthase|nr:phospholipase D-like domain-containing protein [Endomicrobium sp.]
MIIDIFSNFINSDLRAFFATSIYIALSVITSIHLLLHKDDIKSSVGWIALVFLSPFVGTILYIFLGINRVKRKGIRLRKNVGSSGKYSYEIIKSIFDNLPLYFRQFINFGYNAYRQRFVCGNFVEPLQNGIEAYPKMIKDIQNAKKEVFISSYIFNYDSVTDKFLEAFKTAIKNGVSIKILVDGIGTLKFFHRSIEKKLAKIKGLEYGVFLPPHIPVTLPFVNLRNHRKIMTIDGKIAFFGGMNLAKQNVLINDFKNGILDLTFRIEGPVIKQISEVFEDDWEFTTGKKFQSISRGLPNIEAGIIAARIISDGPDNKKDVIEIITHGAINIAIKKILIVTPYFLPENNILTALEMAAMRGVDIEIIIPEKSDHGFIDKAIEPNFLRLVNCGVKIYRTPPPFDHSKIFVVDDEWIFVGSANWDVRSFRLNFESNIEIFSKKLAKKLTMIAEAKRLKAKLVTIAECENLPLLKRIRNNAYHLLTPYG